MKKITCCFLVLYSIFCLAITMPTSPALEQVLPISVTKPHLDGIEQSEAVPISIPTPAPTIQPKMNHHFQLEYVPALSQLPELPNGCEAVVATMLLNWAGVPVTKEEVADALPLGELPYVNDDGAFIGSNPKNVFVGNPYEVGYGIYHKPIADMLDHWLPGRIRDLTGSDFDELLTIIAQGKPAMIWATEHMDTPYLEMEWQDEEGLTVEWYQPEHALLLTGWDEDYAYMNDPMTGKQEAYALSDFKTVWEQMGSQAITVN
ncbi:C39 family peptidase [Paenibacillus alginolyticus]|uniref:C39 family peptidase n=1 Tax=Paenibacillus alginolyticus TaxID=59839 RepID=UPI0013768CFE|nr:C39 family peptidase [Paenibacillus alginolyticus]MCY9666735.1 C39 family peptidase [Paenibacillus alginolyticus]